MACVLAVLLLLLLLLLLARQSVHCPKFLKQAAP
jgi:hypothetical protein